MTTFLDKIRVAAMNCTNVNYRFALHNAADEVSGRLHVVAADPTEANMIDLNGAWAKAAALMRGVPPEGTHDPFSGSTEPTKLAA